MIYFKECRTMDDVKVRYRTLSKIFHPDLGGSTELMQALNAEYEVACKTVLSTEDLTDEAAQEQAEMSEQYRAVIEKIITLPGITLEIVGNWLWVTGNTYPVRQQLKEAGLYFASKKVAWYYRADEYRTKSSGKSLDEIRTKYGTETVHNRTRHRVIK